MKNLVTNLVTNSVNHRIWWQIRWQIWWWILWVNKFGDELGDKFWDFFCEKCRDGKTNGWYVYMARQKGGFGQNVFDVILTYSGWPVGFYQISTTKKNLEYRPNIDHTAFYRPKYRPQKFFKMCVFATFHILRPKSACSFWQDCYISCFPISFFLI